MANWQDCGRDDLSNIPMMIQAGWTPRFTDTDKRYGRVTPEHVPHEAVSFEKGVKVAWKCYHTKHNDIIPYWKVADLIDGYYKNRRDYDQLDEVTASE